MSRKPFFVTEAMRLKALELARVGVPQDDIAQIIGCAPKTLRKKFRKELDCGMAEANAEVARVLYEAAKQCNVTAQIFWLKTRAKLPEAGIPARYSSSDNADANSMAIVSLP